MGRPVFREIVKEFSAANFESLCDPDMRIWSITNVRATPNYLPYALAAGVLVIIATFSTIAFAWRKKRKETVNNNPIKKG